MVGVAMVTAHAYTCQTSGADAHLYLLLHSGQVTAFHDNGQVTNGKPMG